ncbi:MAG: iron-containing alcohol dehydrogenase [Opitutaceae bacterium]|nr:iron-containing alcohol dehydrogenase [Opitutaceae bacterium]
MRFEFATVPRIIFGRGACGEIGALVAGLGRRALVVTGRNVRRAEPLLELLRKAGVQAQVFPVAGEPTTDDIARGVDAARGAATDCVVAFGGGSAIDAAKATAAMLTNPGDVLDYLEVIGRGQTLAWPSLPCIAVPTTAGTGAEATRNAVLASPTARVKASLRSPYLLPHIAVIDPALTDDLPPDLTATTGLDALTQLIEPYVSIRANPMTDPLCVDGMRRAAHALRRAVDHGARDTAARDDMALASLFGGIALANAGLGAVHGFAAPIGGMFHAPHGAVCAALLPLVMETNIRALRERAADHLALRRYEEVARILTGVPTATAEDAVRWTRELVSALPVPSLRACGVTVSDIPTVVAAAAKASSMKANPLPLTTAELTGILQAACA